MKFTNQEVSHFSLLESCKTSTIVGRAYVITLVVVGKLFQNEPLNGKQIGCGNSERNE
jgi:hypothetical protein